MANSNENPNNLFREQSVEKISSPDDLNDYIRVAGVGVWMVLIAVVLLLAGFTAWALNGELTTTVPAVVLSAEGHTDVYVSEKKVNIVEEGYTVRIEDDEDVYIIEAINVTPIDSDDVLSDYAKRLLGIEDGEWIHVMALDHSAPEGTKSADVIIESMKPIDFIIN